jgi:two-component sensor histidine kinase
MNKTVSKTLIHICLLAIIFVLPEVMMSVSSRHPQPMAWIFYAKAAVYVLTFYGEYYLALRSPFQRRRFLIGSVVVMAASLAALYGLLCMQPTGHPAEHHPPVWSMMIREVVMVALTFALSYALKMSTHLTEIERREAQAKEARRTEELKQLKNQLNPHFLFNSLNTIYALTEIDAKRARAATHTLSQLLRYVLYEADKPLVPLKSELDFIEHYVSLMSMRMGSAMRLDVKLDVGDMADVQVAPMLFITLVENAFKHGNTGVAGAEILIHITAADDSVRCQVVNDFVPNSKRGAVGGVGLANLRRRLDLLYAENANLVISQSDVKFAAELTLKLQ